MRPMWPVLALLYAASFWGVIWYPLRLLEAGGLSGTWETLVSYAAALLVLAPAGWGVRGEWRRHPGDLGLLAIASGWTNLAFILAMLDGTVIRVLLLFYLSPLWATLLGRWLLGERLERITALTLPLGLLGVGMMLWPADPGALGGLQLADGLALTAGIAFALSNVITRRLRDTGVVTRTLAAWVGVVLVAGGAVLLRQEPPPAASGEIWLGAVALGACGFLTATLAVIYGVSHMPVQRSAVILLFELLVGGASAWWLAGEAMEPREWLGGGLIVAAGFLSATRGDRHE